jgi:hypothetical protein
MQADPHASIGAGTRCRNGDLDDSGRELLEADFQARPGRCAVPGLVQDLLENLSGSRRIEGSRHARRRVDSYPFASGASA